MFYINILHVYVPVRMCEHFNVFTTLYVHSWGRYVKPTGRHAPNKVERLELKLNIVESNECMLKMKSILYDNVRLN